MNESKLLDKLKEELERQKTELSLEYFNKLPLELDIAEQVKLEKLVYDFTFPEWERIEINGEPTTYEVSNTGQVRNNKTGNVTFGTYIKDDKSKRAYPSIVLYLGSADKYKSTEIHRLVAKYFIPNPENKREVNHIDGRRHHNWVGNLEWATPSENIQHSYDTKLRPVGEANSLSKHTEKEVHFICEKLEQGMRWQDISKTYGMNYSLCHNIYTRDAWTYISKEYNIPEPKHREGFTDEEIHYVCKRLQNGDGYADIANSMDNDRMTRSMVRAIAKGRCYRGISDQYDIPGLTKYKDLPPNTMTEKIKRLFRNGLDINLTAKEIAAVAGMDPNKDSDTALICLIRRDYKKEMGIK